METRTLPPVPEKTDNPLDPRNLLPFTKEISYAEDHVPMEVHAENNPNGPPLHTTMPTKGFISKV